MVVAGLKLRTYVVWIPILDKDEGVLVPGASQHVGVTPQYFDGAMRVGAGLAKAYGVTEPVWDAFYFYPPGARWTEDGLPVPEVAIAQDVGVVVRPVPHAPSIKIGEQKDFRALLQQAAAPFAAKYVR